MIKSVRERDMSRPLLARGYSPDEIDQIWGRNFLRALTAAQAGSI